MYVMEYGDNLTVILHCSDNVVLGDSNQVNVDLATAPNRIIVLPMVSMLRSSFQHDSWAITYPHAS